MIKIAAVEDNIDEQKCLSECLAYTGKEKELEIETDYFGDSTSLLTVYEKGKYDLLLLDIELPDMNGIDLAHKIRDVDPDVVIIFVTNMVNFAIKGYEVEAKDYVVKPINEQSFCLRIGRALKSIIRNPETKLELVDSSGVHRFVNIRDIKYVEVVGHYVTYHAINEDYQEYITMKEVEKRLKSNLFKRCNRCYLVNLAQVTGVVDDCCLVGNDKLIISRGEKKNFISDLAKYMSGGLE